MRLPICALLILASIATTAQPATAMDFCITTSQGLTCGVVPASCWKTSDLVPFVVIECDKILAALK